MRRITDIPDWIFEKHFTELMIAAVIGAAVVLALYAWPSPPGEASGWWQVAIALVGLPLLLHQLYQLRKTFEQTPEIHVGLVPGAPTKQQIQNGIVEPAKAISFSRSTDKSDFSLVVENRGRIPAKSVTINLHYTPFKGDSPPATMWARRVDLFMAEPSGDLIYRGGDNLVLYPNDPQVHNFSLGHRSHKGLKLLLRELQVGDHHLSCTIFAEGLDKPVSVSEDLVIRITE